MGKSAQEGKNNSRQRGNNNNNNNKIIIIINSRWEFIISRQAGDCKQCWQLFDRLAVGQPKWSKWSK